MEWISVKDRLPSREEKVIFTRNNQVDCGYFQYHWDISNVTHWMPLPQPPKDE